MSKITRDQVNNVFTPIYQGMLKVLEDMRDIMKAKLNEISPEKTEEQPRRAQTLKEQNENEPEWPYR